MSPVDNDTDKHRLLCRGPIRKQEYLRVLTNISIFTSPAENSEAIEIPFVFRTRVDPGKDLLHTADCFGRILHYVHSTQYSLVVCEVIISSMQPEY